jgi:cytochrome c peroxidase
MAVALALSVFANRALAQEEEPPPAVPGPLSAVPVPLPSNLADFVQDMNAAKVLGKALFWDMQVGGDGHTACATCHFHAGADARTRNTIGVRTDTFRGANKDLTAADFPFHRFEDPNDRGSAVVFDTTEVVGAQGVVFTRFLGIRRNPVDRGVTIPDPVFNVGGVNTRRVTGRNTPTVINAVFNDRNFWDGRANRIFNGVNPFGETDPNAMVWKFTNRQLTRTRVLLTQASLASQAVGPPNNDVEMSWSGRTFPDLGKKMLALKPLALQQVDRTDSVLGRLANRRGKGLTTRTYADLVKAAFKPEWWASPRSVDGVFTQMEANFSLFWGLSINLYESLLVSDQTAFDRFSAGDATALTEEQKIGLDLFLTNGRCINCHSGAEFTEASVSAIAEEGPVGTVVLQNGVEAFYDEGFFNIGVRPTANDVGVGANGPFGPFSITRRVQHGEDLGPGVLSVPAGAPIAVDGAFKIPGLRNVELTGPYFHNGGVKNLTEVVQFYARGADFFDENIDNLAPDVDGIGKVRGNPERVAAIVAFLKSLTDDRVRFQKAPFDHPELVVPNGHSQFRRNVALDNDVVIPAVGANGGPAIRSFEEILNGAPLAPR